MRGWGQKLQHRRGLLNVTFTGAGLLNKGVTYDGVAEVEELERTTTRSHIRVTRVTGIGDRYREKQARDLIPEWVATAHIEWLSEAGLVKA